MMDKIEKRVITSLDFKPSMIWFSCMKTWERIWIMAGRWRLKNICRISCWGNCRNGLIYIAYTEKTNGETTDIILTRRLMKICIIYNISWGYPGATTNGRSIFADISIIIWKQQYYIKVCSKSVPHSMIQDELKI